MERLLQDLIDLMPVGVWVADSDGRFVRINRAARRMWGISEPVDLNDVAAFRAWDANSGEELSPGDWGLDRALHGETCERLLQIRCPDGSERTVGSAAAPLFSEQGQLTGAVIVHEDVTEFLAMRRLSEHRSELLQAVLDLLPVGVFRIDEQGEVVEANPAARRIWGLDENSPIPTIGSFVAKEVATGEPVTLGGWGSAQALSRAITVRDELLEIQGFNGSVRTIFNSAAPIFLHQPYPVGAVAVNQDVSSLYRTQQQLRAAVRDREQLLAWVAHDLRNPLAGLILLADSIEQCARKDPDSPETIALAGKVRDRIHGLAGLVDDLLAIGVGGLADASMLNLEKAEPGELVDFAIEQVKELFAAAGIDLERRVSQGLPSVLVDRRRMQRVWSNLLDNALKYTKPGGRVVVGAAAQGAVSFSIANSGTPLPDAQLHEMFKPFWQARRDKRGAGLGLSIVRAIVEAHGGSIWAEGAEGQSVCIKFELPRIELAGPPPEVAGSRLLA